jgi:hypothetical protein
MYLLISSCILFSVVGQQSHENTEKLGSTCLQKSTTTSVSDDLEADLKIRTVGGEWIDGSLSADVGAKLEFSIRISSLLSTGHEGVFVVVLLPKIDEDPMFTYSVGSSSDPPIHADNEVLIWIYTELASNSPKELMFQARIAKSGTGRVDLTVNSLVPEDSDEDYIQVTGKKGRHCISLQVAKFVSAITSVYYYGNKEIAFHPYKNKYGTPSSLLFAWLFQPVGRNLDLYYLK